MKFDSRGMTTDGTRSTAEVFSLIQSVPSFVAWLAADEAQSEGIGPRSRMSRMRRSGISAFTHTYSGICVTDER